MTNMPYPCFRKHDECAAVRGGPCTMPRCAARTRNFLGSWLCDLPDGHAGDHYDSEQGEWSYTTERKT